jgi:hypothetical protein
MIAHKPKRQIKEKGGGDMGYDATGKIYIPLEEFWEFAAKYLPESGAEVSYGIPHVEGNDLEIDYAASTSCNPSEWTVRPDAVTQWDKK